MFSPGMLQQVYAYAGNKDKTLDWLEKGVEVRDPNMLIMDVTPLFVDLLARRTSLSGTAAQDEPAGGEIADNPTAQSCRMVPPFSREGIYDFEFFFMSFATAQVLAEK